MSATLQDVVDQLKELNKGMESPGDRRERELETAKANEKLAKTLAGLKGNGSGGGTVVQQNIGSGTFGLGGLLGGLGIGVGSALSGLGAAGAGLGAFFLGLAGAEAIMTKFGSGDNLKNLLTNLAEGLKAFGDRELIALGAVLGTGALFGAVPLLSGGGAGIGIGAVGLGLGAFFAGLGAGEAGLSWMNVDGARLKSMMVNLAEGLSAFADRDLAILGTLLGGAAAGGALFGPSAVPGALVGMGAMGLGIGAFFAGLATADAAANYMKVDGNKLKSIMKNLAEGLSAFDNQSLVVLGGLLGTGALFGAVAGPAAIAGATIGMGAIGAGIGAFFGGLGIADWALDKLGANGSGLRDIMINLADGLVAFAPLASFDAVAVGAGLAAIGGGLVAFFGGTLVSTLMDKVDTFVNWLTGDDRDQKTKFQNIVDVLKPFEQLKIENLQGLDLASNSIDKLSDAMDRMANIDPKQATRGITEAAKNIAYMLKILDPMLQGNVFRDAYQVDGKLYPVDIDFGKGLRAAQGDVDEVSTIVGKARQIFAPMGGYGETGGTPSIAAPPVAQTSTGPLPGQGQGFGVLMNNGGNTSNNTSVTNTGYVMGMGQVDDMYNGNYSASRLGRPAGR